MAVGAKTVGGADYKTSNESSRNSGQRAAYRQRRNNHALRFDGAEKM